RVEFVAVVAPDIARTARGLAVGLPIVEADHLLGERLDGPRRLADPRLIRYAVKPHLQVVSDGGPGAAPERVAGILVLPPPAEESAARTTARRRCGARGEPASALIAAARLESERLVPGCFVDGEPDVLVTGDDALAVVGGDSGKPRRLAFARVPGLAFAGALDVDGDG